MSTFTEVKVSKQLPLKVYADFWQAVADSTAVYVYLPHMATLHICPHFCTITKSSPTSPSPFSMFAEGNLSNVRGDVCTSHE